LADLFIIGVAPIDYSPILLLKPFGFRIAPDSRVGLRIVLFEMLWGGGEEIASIVADVNRWSPQCKRRTT
jgi:hypothetical protein